MLQQKDPAPHFASTKRHKMIDRPIGSNNIMVTIINAKIPNIILKIYVK